MQIEDDRYDRQIWLWDGDARQLTFGGGDSAPRWSPDGSKLAFLRRVDDTSAPQVAILPADGGEAQVITEFDLGVLEFEWSPDSATLAVVAVEWAAGWEDRTDDERAAQPRRITAGVYRADTQGWRHDRERRVWIVPVDGGAPRRLTTLGVDEQAPAWAADGASVLFVQAFADDRHIEPGGPILRAAVDGSGVDTVHPTGQWARPVAHPDGRVFGVGDPDPRAWPGLVSLWDLTADEPQDLTGHLDRSVWSFLLPPEMATPAWVDDGFAIGLVDSGRVHVISMIGSEVSVLVGGDRYVNGFAASADGDRIVFTAHDPTRPGDLYEIVGGEERRLTALNDEFVAEVPLVTPTHLRVESDGVEIDAWVLLPEGDEPVPVLLNIHGGPASQYGFSFFDEFQVYAGAGYGVVACNPRGSSGRGKEFVRAVTGDGWGTVDQQDVMAVLDHALERFDRLDGDRIGIMGGSYGGFLSAWMTARSDRFRSSVVERALLSWESFSGTSDIGSWFSNTYLHAALPDGVDTLRDASPLSTVDRITVPTLIVHSENDFRCPIEQAEQLFMALLKNGVTTEFIRFPGESHELSRSGKPQHRVSRFEFILEWHDRFLRGN